VRSVARSPDAGEFAESAHTGLRLALLDRFELSDRGAPIALAVPAQRLIAFLAIEGRVVLRAYAASALWIDSTEERASGSLRSALWRLRQVDHGLVEGTSRDVRLTAGVDVDLREVSACARKICDGAVATDELDVDAGALSADLLPDWYDDWIVLERERFRELRVRALESLCEQYTAAEQFGRAMDAALAAVKIDPLRESAHRAAIGVHLAEGNWAEALQRYESYRRLLRRELGFEPSSRISALVACLTLH
jgi:DNA-binding SARP family transcriptional activator